MAGVTTAGMFNRLAMYFVAALFLTTAVAVLLPDPLGLLFLPAGILVMAAGYMIGGGHSIRPAIPSGPIQMSSTLAQAELEVRMYERDVNWNPILLGFLIGITLEIAGVVSFFV